MGWSVMCKANAHTPKRVRLSIITNQVIKICHYYHQPGDQKYAKYSKIIRQPAAIITNQVIKSTPSTSNYT
ncbi:hypothetical protein ACFX2B_025251 [Malus domestica]